jgi:hypothetical protein
LLVALEVRQMMAVAVALAVIEPHLDLVFLLALR